jgi:N-acetylglucosaminyldiphosphoundecaprenol N-acetyl-beta-D-mannosaminyltransferase
VIARRGAVLLGTPVDDVTLEESIELIAEMVETGRRTGRVHQIATVNVDFVVNAFHDAEVQAIMRSADLSIPDGMGIVWGSRALGTPLRQRSAGADLVPELAARAARDGWKLCLFGGPPGVAERAADVLRERSPDVDIVVVAAPPVPADGSMDEAVVQELRAVGADVVAVALGNPKQERWIARHGAAVGAPVCIGIGGTLDFITGATTRAPVWMQRSGLEWIHRALSEPRRLVRRYAHDIRIFAPRLARQMWRGRVRRGRGDVLVVPAPRSHHGDAIVDLGALRRLDNRAVATTVSAVRAWRLGGRVATVTGASARVVRDAERLDARVLIAPE